MKNSVFCIGEEEGCGFSTCLEDFINFNYAVLTTQYPNHNSIRNDGISVHLKKDAAMEKCEKIHLVFKFYLLQSEGDAIFFKFYFCIHRNLDISKRIYNFLKEK